MIQLDNFPTDEVSEVYQRCVLVSGKCNTDSARELNDGHVVVETGDGFGKTLFPEQRWPMCHGHFKALLLLSPGLNKITITTQDDIRTEVQSLAFLSGIIFLQACRSPSDTSLFSRHHLYTWPSSLPRTLPC